MPLCKILNGITFCNGIKINRICRAAANTIYEAVINFTLAEANGLEIGEELEIATQTGKVVTVKITGMYITGNERNQMDTLSSADRLENRIFIDNYSLSSPY